ncbi:MAG: MOSC domain-containing protein [Verrucomicrobiota bacterium]
MDIKIKAIYISPGHDFYGRHNKGRLDHGIEQLDTVECVAGSGLKGDRFFDYKEDFKGQITFFDWAVHQRMKIEFNRPDLEPYVFRRNVLIEGVDLNTLIGQRFQIQGITFEGSEESTPCYWMNEAIADGAEDALKGYGGIRARILTDGALSVDAD